MQLIALWFCMLAIAFAGCNRQQEIPTVPLPIDAPKLVIDDYEYTKLPGVRETASWQVAGSGVGELVLRLLRFEDGEVAIAREQRFTAPNGAVKGTVTVENDGMAVATNMSFSHASPIRAELPSTPARKKTHAETVTFRSLPGQSNQAQLWSHLHGEHAPTVANLSPWTTQRANLLTSCVNGTAATVVTIEMVSK